VRTVAVGEGKALKLSADQKLRLQNFLVFGHKDAISQRFGVEKMWQRADTSYQGQSPADPRWTPFKEAPVIEVTIGAMCVDSVAAQANNLIFQSKPILLVRPTKEEWEPHADALQSLVNIEMDSKAWNFRSAATEAIIDVTKMGNFVLYVPFTKTVRKTDIRQIVSFGPKIYCLPLEDFILPTNATKDVQSCPFATMRLWMGKKQLNLKARLNNWTVDDAVGADANSGMRHTRMRTVGLEGAAAEKFEQVAIADTFCYFDLDNDGIESDLEVIWNMQSGNIMKAKYNRNDCRPFVLECYQDQPHTWVGLGIMPMSEQFERMATELWNNHVWNAMIANMKVFKGNSSSMQEATQIYPGKFLITDNGAVDAMDMGNVNPASIQAFTMLMAMVRERTGTQLLNQPIRNTSRTPANTMQMMTQQSNTRFTPQFDNMREGFAEAARQCLYRIQEQVKGGPNQRIVKNYIIDLLGKQKGELVIRILKHKDPLSRNIDVQLAAVSVSVNKDADRQSLIQLASQIYPLYFQAMQQLAPIKAHPPFPGADKVADQAAEMLNKVMHKLLKTYDQLAEVEKLTIDLDEIQPVMAQLGMEQVPGQMEGMLTGMQPQTGTAQQ
jgi:hypothetical protein